MKNAPRFEVILSMLFIPAGKETKSVIVEKVFSKRAYSLVLCHNGKYPAPEFPPPQRPKAVFRVNGSYANLFRHRWVEERGQSMAFVADHIDPQSFCDSLTGLPECRKPGLGHALRAFNKSQVVRVNFVNDTELNSINLSTWILPN